MAKCRRLCWRSYIYLCLAAISSICCDARKSAPPINAYKHSKNSETMMSPLREIINAILMKRVDMDMASDSSSNTQPYGVTVSSPFSLPPYDSLPPIPLPENAPPFCVNPPFTPQPPSTTVPTPTGGYTYNPPPPAAPIENPPVGTVPSPPEWTPAPNPPAIIIPNPPSSIPSPSIPVPTTPPSSSPTPPAAGNIPSPPISYVPSPSVFLPPIVYPPPAVPPPPRVAPAMALWCVAKPSVPGPIIQEAMNYACASGADCDQIQPSGSCFEPNTLFAHASYAFNSYWQRTKVAGGTCEFGGTAILVTVDPSYDGCHFIYF